MKLKYCKQIESEGGNAVPGVGTIHVSEINDTLTALSSDLELPFDLTDFTVGSTGKSEYSGDIDLVIDKQWYDISVEELHKDLKSLFGTDAVSRTGSMLHLKYPIVGFNKIYSERLPRTGFVQVDFIFGNLEWERFYHYSHGSESEYKGFHRNIAVTAITAATAVVYKTELDDYGRPTSIEKWKWGSNGLFRVLRNSNKRANGSWLKTQTDLVIAGPIINRDIIASTIFPIDGTVDDLNSLETIILAIKRNYSRSVQDIIFKKIAESFSKTTDALYFSYPPEIEQYFRPDIPLND